MNPEELKQQLAELEKQLKSATTAEAKAQVDAQKKEIEQKLSEATKDVPELRKELNEAKATIVEMKDAADKNQKALDDLLAQGEHAKLPDGKKSFNTLLSEGIAENIDAIKTGIDKRQPKLSTGFQFKAVGDMSFSANFSTADQSVTTLKPGIIELPKRKLHIRELLPGGSMNNSTFTFVREATTGEGNPATVAEGNWKEQLDIDLEEVDSPTQYIAGYLVISRKMLDDVQGMTSFLQSRLLEKYLRTEDVQLLYGSGVSPNLSGITTAGNFTAPTSAATIDIEQIIMAISQLEMADREANGVLVSPQDYYRMMTYKASTSGEYTAPLFGLATTVNGQLYIAGVPVFKSTAMASDKFIVGDWRMGAQLITREAPRVEFFYEDGYNVRRNQVTVRVEGRIAFPIYGSNYFIYGDLGNS